MCGVASIADAARPCVRRSLDRLSRRADRALEVTGGERPPFLHAARRSAKRARYATDAIGPAYGEPADALAARLESVQDALGESQDAHVSRGLLLELATASLRRGHDPTTFGVLVGLEEVAARQAVESFASLWAEARRRRHRRWLTA